MNSARDRLECKEYLTEYINRCLNEGIKDRNAPGFTTDTQVLAAADARLRSTGAEGFDVNNV
jgi:hypothetical protein